LKGYLDLAFELLSFVSFFFSFRFLVVYYLYYLSYSFWKGASLNALDHDGEAPIDKAVRGGFIEFVSTLRATVIVQSHQQANTLLL
jgi:hypothetical protein